MDNQQNNDTTRAETQPEPTPETTQTNPTTTPDIDAAADASDNVQPVDAVVDTSDTNQAEPGSTAEQTPAAATGPTNDPVTTDSTGDAEANTPETPTQTQTEQPDEAETSNMRQQTAQATHNADGQAAVQDETLQATIQTLEERIADLEKQSKEHLEGWQRSRAEFTNFKRRKDRELSEAGEKASLDTLAKMLPIFDDFQRALANIPEDLQGHPWMNGTSLIMKNIEKLLDEHNVEVLDPVGEAFDPRKHEAIGMDDSSDYESGTVTATLQKGYISGERVLRPAYVRVAN